MRDIVEIDPAEEELIAGRDTDPKSGQGFIRTLVERGDKVATIIGRYYAMDRDKRLERVKVAYDQLVNGEGKKADDMVNGFG